MTNWIDWNIENVPVRYHDPLPTLSLKEYNTGLQNFLRNWLRHNEKYEEQTIDGLNSYTIYRNELSIGKFEFEYPIGKPKLFLVTHLIALERAVEEFGLQGKDWPTSVYKSVDRMLFFYNKALQTLRELEGNTISSEPIPTLTQSLLWPSEIPGSRVAEQQNQTESGIVKPSPNPLDNISQTHRFQEKCRKNLLEILTKYFNENELKTLCFHLNIAYEDLPALGRSNKARELVTYLERHNLIIKLLNYGQSVRPDISWPSIQDCT